MALVRELRAVFARRDVRAGLLLYVVAVFASGVRTFSGVLSSTNSVLAVASADDNTWYLSVVASTVLGSMAAAVFLDTGRAGYAWSAGASKAHQVAGRVACGMLAGAVAGLLYWLTRMGSASVSLALADDAGRTTTAGLPVAWGFAGRLVLVCVLLGGLGACAGLVAHRPVAATGLALVLVASLLPLFEPLAVRLPGLVRLQSFLPGGAATTLLEANAGLPIGSGVLQLRSGRPAWAGLVLVLGWAVLLVAAGLARWRTARSPEQALRRRVAAAVGAPVVVVVVLAMVLPPLARDALPWYLHPDWLHDSRRGRSSIDAVEAFVRRLQQGEAPVAVVDPADAFWGPLRSGTVDVAGEREMQSPESVPVVVTDPGERGGRYTYRFSLTRTDEGWEVSRVEAVVG